MKLSVMMHKQAQTTEGDNTNCTVQRLNSRTQETENERDLSYWERRKRNNEAARKSRAKRRVNETALEKKVIELFKENHVLRAQLDAIREKHGISGANLVSAEKVLASLPSFDLVVPSKKTLSLTASFQEHYPTSKSSEMKNTRPVPALNPIADVSDPQRFIVTAHEQNDSLDDDSSSCSSASWLVQKTGQVSSISPRAVKRMRTSASPCLDTDDCHSEPKDLKSTLLRLTTEMEKLKRYIEGSHNTTKEQ